MNRGGSQGVLAQRHLQTSDVRGSARRGGRRQRDDRRGGGTQCHGLPGNRARVSRAHSRREARGPEHEPRQMQNHPRIWRLGDTVVHTTGRVQGGC
jgi:hypothetical protein